MPAGRVDAARRLVEGGRRARVRALHLTVALRDRLGRARAAVSGAVAGALGRGIDDAAWEAVEEALLRADLGVATTGRVLGSLRRKVEAREVDGSAGLVAALRDEMEGQLAGADRAMRMGASAPSIWLVVGVNGAGKTTTIGKLAAQQVAAGRTVVLAAGDTFRAAAGEQLAEWARRTGADLVRGADGGDPSAVVFDAVQRAAARGADLVIADTAGRLQSNANLMEELRKVRRVAGKGPGEVSEVLLVIDATTGQNGLVQARDFAEAAGVTGVALTKLDGSAKGGIAFAIESELGIPIKVVGTGEQVDDLVAFDPAEFVAALFDE
ncbi:MAG: signal recognition particle-docking protein FtsY [Actinobacteria bacterium]|nr:signal recognition particle-docking protein FtsY [Actinomycetota bacterium]